MDYEAVQGTTGPGQGNVEKPVSRAQARPGSMPPIPSIAHATVVCSHCSVSCHFLMMSNLQEEYDLHNGILSGLGIVTIDAAKLSGTKLDLSRTMPCHLNV